MGAENSHAVANWMESSGELYGVPGGGEEEHPFQHNHAREGAEEEEHWYWAED
ncbi:hypothetical protein A2U01_0101112, partial [Trifolium medium]|nr:hypothetical protein [Trifolium medium]